MAQYFDEHPNAPVKMEVPVGSYAVDFIFSAEALPIVNMAEPGNGAESSIVGCVSEAESDARNDLRKGTRWPHSASKRALVAYAFLICIAVGFGSHRLLQIWRQPDFWQPMVRYNKPTRILLAPTFRPIEGPNDKIVYLSGDVRLNTAIAATDICGALRDRGRQCQIMPAETATLADIYNNPVVLVGAIGDPWVERLMSPLRFQFFREADPNSPRWKYGYIVDRSQSTDDSPWVVDFISGPGQNEYFIIARFQSETTDGPVVIAAGLGSTSSRNAAGYVASPEQMAAILSLAPPNWKGTNFEVVCQLDLIQGHPGHVRYWRLNSGNCKIPTTP